MRADECVWTAGYWYEPGVPQAAIDAAATAMVSIGTDTRDLGGDARQCDIVCEDGIISVRRVRTLAFIRRAQLLLPKDTLDELMLTLDKVRTGKSLEVLVALRSVLVGFEELVCDLEGLVPAEHRD